MYQGRHLTWGGYPSFSRPLNSLLGVRQIFISFFLAKGLLVKSLRYVHSFLAPWYGLTLYIPLEVKILAVLAHENNLSRSSYSDLYLILILELFLVLLPRRWLGCFSLILSSNKKCLGSTYLPVYKSRVEDKLSSLSPIFEEPDHSDQTLWTFVWKRGMG